MEPPNGIAALLPNCTEALDMVVPTGNTATNWATISEPDVAVVTVPVRADALPLLISMARD